MVVWTKRLHGSSGGGRLNHVAKVMLANDSQHLAAVE